ncbi:DUF2865 domain-containing protein [Methylocystis bryophila]|uniref:DUF2865 domain-containing protein n=1 Tax=Methylocystis bryophila TaxID=655015 RepID=A0A1W6MTT7_9HYPH|nr:DUF2865 domain-containing protein [Methylocystis bryophila]ARN80936.1 hypothetical protein B1812_07455 [Methylocystis bryophila]BDV36837.1 hypothetical protein DSM21852_00900 [Methylocystis bryophila]
MPTRFPPLCLAPARAGLSRLFRGRQRLSLRLAGLLALLALLAFDAPHSRAWAFFFDDFGGSDSGYGDYGYPRGGGGEHWAHRRHPRRSRAARLGEGHGRHWLGAWTVASDPQNLSSVLHKSAYSAALPPGAAFSTPLFTRTICVRACDGYSFGRAAAYAGYNAASREAVCNAACPDAETKLFVLPPGVEDVDKAKEAHRGESYAQLLAKFRERDAKPASCGCHVASSSKNDAKALLSDPTLRQGDMVVTEEGVQVFLGRGALPHRTSEFLSLARTNAVSPAYRGALTAIDKMVKLRPARAHSELDRRP